MKRWLFAVAVGALGLCSAGSARAEVSAAPSPSARVFDDAGFNASVTKAITSELGAVERVCEFEEFSREGPDPKELARCEAEVAKLVRRGSSAIGPILAAIDKEDMGWNVRRRLYDVLARTKDARLIEPLIRGMARITTRKLDRRSWEADIIHETLSEITRAPVGEEVPWATAPIRSPRQHEISRVVDWRLWLEDNRGLSHNELAARRLQEARADVDGSNRERAYKAVVYLLTREPAEGLAAAKKYVAQSEPDSSSVSDIEWRIERAEAAVAEAAKRARAAAPAAKAKAKAPAAKVPAKAPAKKALPVATTLS